MGANKTCKFYKCKPGGSGIESGKKADRVIEEDGRNDRWQNGKEGICGECAGKTTKEETEVKMD